MKDKQNDKFKSKIIQAERKIEQKPQRRPVISLENVSRTFGSGESTMAAIKDINLEVFAGEYIIIYGPSGCGKSTLLNIMAGLEIPTKGTVRIRGEDLTRKNSDELALHRRSKIGMIFQQFNVLRTMNVLDNVALTQLFAGVNKQVRQQRAKRLLGIFGLSKHIHKLPSELSGGQQQRVAIARALATNPWIVLADEPTGNLDSKSADEVMDMIKSLNQKSKRTIVLVTHNPDYVYHPHRVIYMKDGQIIRIVDNKNYQLTEDVDINKIGEIKRL